MDDSEVKDWAMLVRANDRSGVLARISLLCQHFGVNLDFVRFDPDVSRFSSGLLVFRCSQEVADRLARKVTKLVDVIDVDVVALADTEGGGAEASSPSHVAEVSTPRDLDDLMDGIAERLPAYSRWLTERLRQFRVASDPSGSSPPLAR